MQSVSIDKLRTDLGRIALLADNADVRVRVEKFRPQRSAVGLISVTLELSFGTVTVTTGWNAVVQARSEDGWYAMQSIEHACSGIASDVDIVDVVDEAQSPPLLASSTVLQAIADECWSYWDFDPWLSAALAQQ